jgi:capsid portal protein
MDRRDFKPIRDRSETPIGADSMKGSDLMDLLEQMQQLAESCREDYNKAKGGNKAAGTRVRKVMQEIKNVAQDIRKEMLGNRED